MNIIKIIIMDQALQHIRMQLSHEKFDITTYNGLFMKSAVTI